MEFWNGIARWLLTFVIAIGLLMWLYLYNHAVGQFGGNEGLVIVILAVKMPRYNLGDISDMELQY